MNSRTARLKTRMRLFSAKSTSERIISLLRHALEELKLSPKDPGGRGWQTSTEALESATAPLICVSRYRSTGKPAMAGATRPPIFRSRLGLRMKSSAPPASSAPGLSEKERRRRGRVYCTAKALSKLGWFLRDFLYDPDLLERLRLWPFSTARGPQMFCCHRRSRILLSTGE